MDNTIIQQGRFTSTGNNRTLVLRADTDWVEVYNMAVIGAPQVAGVVAKWYWQRGMAAGVSVGFRKSNAANAANLIDVVLNTFNLIDDSANPNGILQTLTAISGANPPVVSSIAHGLEVDDVVKIINTTGAQQFGGMDFTVGNGTLTANTFSLDYAPQIVAGTNGFFRKINHQPLFYPRNRSITAITLAAQAVITMSVSHNFSVGQKVSIRVPPIFGMEQIGGRGTVATVVATTDGTITVDIDSTAFTPFVFPLDGDVPFTSAQVTPVGEDTSFALAQNANILADAIENIGIIGIELVAGVDGPGGSAGEVIFWKSGKSFSVDNQ